MVCEKSRFNWCSYTELLEWDHAKHLASLSFHSGSTESTKKRDFCKLNLEAGNENTQSCFFQIMPLFHLSMVAYKDLYQVHIRNIVRPMWVIQCWTKEQSSTAIAEDLRPMATVAKVWGHSLKNRTLFKEIHHVKVIIFRLSMSNWAQSDEQLCLNLK